MNTEHPLILPGLENGKSGDTAKHNGKSDGYKDIDVQTRNWREDTSAVHVIDETCG